MNVIQWVFILYGAGLCVRFGWKLKTWQIEKQEKQNVNSDKRTNQQAERETS